MTTNTPSIYMVIDTETSGLPIIISKSSYYDYSDYDKYDSSRIVQLSYQLFDNSKNLLKTVNIYIKPNGFIIPDNVIEIHHITNEMANEKGVPIQIAFQEFEHDLINVTSVIGHNVLFDKQVILSELSRCNLVSIIELFISKQFHCTQLMSAKCCKSIRPSLATAYKHIINREIVNQHDALYDVIHCAEIFFELFDKETD